MCESDQIRVIDLPPAVRGPEDLAPATENADAATPSSAADDERKAALIELLTSHGGNVTAVAKAMGKARMQIHRWAKRYDIDLGSFKV